MEEKVFTVDELCSYLNLKKSKIYRRTHRKQIPFTKIGNQLRFPKYLIDAWVMQQTYIPFGMKKCYNTQTVEGEE